MERKVILFWTVGMTAIVLCAYQLLFYLPFTNEIIEGMLVGAILLCMVWVFSIFMLSLFAMLGVDVFVTMVDNIPRYAFGMLLSMTLIALTILATTFVFLGSFPAGVAILLFAGYTTYGADPVSDWCKRCAPIKRWWILSLFTFQAITLFLGFIAMGLEMVVPAICVLALLSILPDELVMAKVENQPKAKVSKAM